MARSKGKSKKASARKGTSAQKNSSAQRSASAQSKDSVRASAEAAVAAQDPTVALRKPSRSFWIAVVASVAAIIGGGICWIVMLSNGLLATTGLNNIFNWGLLIAVFAFLVGFGAGAQFVASGLVYTRDRLLMRFAIPAQAIALAGGCGAGIAIIADLGQPGHMLSLVSHPNFMSPLTWDMIALSLFVVASVVCLVALARRWDSLRVWMGIGAACALFLQIVEGVLFSSQGARAWWSSIIMPIDFVVVAFVSGLALMTAVCALSSREGARKGARTLGDWLFWAVLVHIALALIELFLLMSEGEGGPAMALSLVLGSLWLYIIELGLPLAAVIVLRIGLREESSVRMFWCSVAVIVGLFAHRIMLLVPALGGVTLFTQLSNEASPYWAYPASTGFYASAKETFALSTGLLPSGIEWASILLPIGAMVLIAVVCTRLASVPGAGEGPRS